MKRPVETHIKIIMNRFSMAEKKSLETAFRKIIRENKRAMDILAKQ